MKSYKKAYFNKMAIKARPASAKKGSRYTVYHGQFTFEPIAEDTIPEDMNLYYMFRDQEEKKITWTIEYPSENELEKSRFFGSFITKDILPLERYSITNNILLVYDWEYERNSK